MPVYPIIFVWAMLITVRQEKIYYLINDLQNKNKFYTKRLMIYF